MPAQNASTDRGIPTWSRALVGGALSAIPGRHDDRYGGSIRTVAVAFFANLVVAVAKYGGFVLTGSSALIAEAIHSTAVTTNQGLMLRGRLTGRQPETPEHPFGFGRVRYFWAFMVSVVMFGIGAVLSIGRGVFSIVRGGEHGISIVWVPYAALTLGLLMDGASLLQARGEAQREKGELSYREFVQRSKNPEVPVVFMEDAAAMIGLLFAYAGVTLTLVTGNHLWDGLASILIGALLAVVASFLGREMKSLILGESALPEEEQQIREVLTSHDDVREVIYFRSLYLGPEDLLVEAKVAFDRDLRFPRLVEAINEIEAEIRHRLDHVRLISIEPDVAEGEDVEVPAYKRS